MRVKRIGRLIKSALMGIGIGSSLILLISCINGTYVPVVPTYLATQPSTLVAVLKATGCYALIGALSEIYACLYESKYIERYFFSISCIHFSLILGTLLLVGKYLHWFRGDLLAWLSFIIIFLLIYLVLWLFIGSMRKREIVKLNRELQHRNHSRQNH